MIERLPSPYPKQDTPSVPDPISPYRASLCARITHPDIILRVLSFLPATYLPSTMRVSRDFHALSGPLLYYDLSLPLSGLALPPHISPIGSLLDRAACGSAADQHALLSQPGFVTRQRAMLQSTRTLRLGYHSHHVLPRIMRDLVLNMARVEVLHLEGSAVCHHDHCPTLKNLRPKVISLEAMGLDAVARPAECMDIRGIASMERVEHVMVKLRPTSLGVFPSWHTDTPPPLPKGRHAPRRRLSIVFTPNTYLDGTGYTIHQSWRPSRFSPCGTSGTTAGPGAQPTAKPSFCDFVSDVARACVTGGWNEVTFVGAETVDETWVKSCIKEHRWKCEKQVQHEQEWGRCMSEGCNGRGCMSVSEVIRCEIVRQIGVEQERFFEAVGASMVDQEITFVTKRVWREGPDGHLLDPAEIGMGYKGKGHSTSARPLLPKCHSM